MRTELGPDATGVGWVFQYALVDDRATHSLAELRTFQDWNLRYRLQSVPGVAEVASLGGFEKQYQVTVDPQPAQGLRRSRSWTWREAIRRSNNEVGGRLLEFSGSEYMVRGRGYVRGTEDLEKIVLKPTSRARRCCCATWPRSPRARRSAAASPTSTATATRSAGSSSCATARTRAR